jgi:hypothetical protein
VIEAAGKVGATSATLLSEPAAQASSATPTQAFAFDGTPADATTEPFRGRFVVPGGKAERALELGWTDGRDEVDRDTEIAVDIFCEYLGDALDALKLQPVPARPSSRLGPQA